MSSRGQVVIQRNIRKHLKLRYGDSLAVMLSGNLIVLKRVNGELEADDNRTLASLQKAGLFADRGKPKLPGEAEVYR